MDEVSKRSVPTVRTWFQPKKIVFAHSLNDNKRTCKEPLFFLWQRFKTSLKSKALKFSRPERPQA